MAELDKFQTDKVWDGMLNAEARALYFADLVTKYTFRKQIITGLSFFLSSGAAATAIAKAPNWVPVLLALISALATAYSIAVGLDHKVGTMAKLQSAWNRIATEYNHLWSHAFAEDAQKDLEVISQQEILASELAATDAPNDQALLARWQDHVFAMHRLTVANE